MERARGTFVSIQEHAKYLIAAYPLTVLLVLFVVPLLLVFRDSFYRNISGGYYTPAFTVENYVRFFTTSVYFNRMVFTLLLAVVVMVVTLLLGYPLAYYLANLRNDFLRRVLIILTMSSLWITYVIRAYAWGVVLASDGVLSKLGVAVGVLDHPTSFQPSFWALVTGLVYVLLPFMVLVLYTSLKNVDPTLREASKNLGAGPVYTFRKVTLPLSKNGIVSGSLLVFILTLGTYVLPKILGKPKHWTLPVIIGDQINLESNVPFASAMSIVLVVTVLLLLFVANRIGRVDLTGSDEGRL